MNEESRWCSPHENLPCFEVSGASLGSSICWLWHLQWQFQDPIDWRYRFHIFLAYFSGLNFREYPQKIWPEIWYSTFILGSWNSHWHLWADRAMWAALQPVPPPKTGGLVSQLVFVYLIVLTASNQYQRVYLIIIPLITPLIIFSPTPWISILPSISTHEIPFISMNINIPIQYHHEYHETNLHLLTHPLIYVLGVNEFSSHYK